MLDAQIEPLLFTPLRRFRKDLPQSNHDRKPQSLPHSHIFSLDRVSSLVPPPPLTTPAAASRPRATTSPPVLPPPSPSPRCHISVPWRKIRLRPPHHVGLDRAELGRADQGLMHCGHPSAFRLRPNCFSHNGPPKIPPVQGPASKRNCSCTIGLGRKTLLAMPEAS
jgi:hypothetical protein